jgi:hypothetical protein
MLLTMTRDRSPNVRASAVHRLANDEIADDGHSNAMLTYVDLALADPDPSVRGAAVSKLRILEIPEKEKIMRLEQALLDKSDIVFTSAVNTIHRLGLHSIKIEVRIAERKDSLDPQTQREIQHTQDQLHKQTRSLWTAIKETAADTRHHGVRVYGILAAIGIALAAGFSIYYVYRMLVFVQEGRHRVFRVLAVLVIWTGLTYAMVALFVIGAFGFGHNSLVANKDQFIIDGVMAAGLSVYAFFGWLMKKLINRKL